MHSHAGIGLGEGSTDKLIVEITLNKSTRTRWEKTRVLIIDEISMIHRDLFDKLENIARAVRNNDKPFGGIQMIITGDFFQLPPIRKRNEPKNISIYAFNAKTWNTVIDHTFELKQVFRQTDDVFVKVLEETRIGELSQHSNDILSSLNRPLDLPPGVKPVKLLSKVVDVDNANYDELNKLTTELHTFKAGDSGTIGLLKDCRYPPVLNLKVGAQVVLLKNMPLQNLVNGSIGIVKDFYEGYPSVVFSNGIEIVLYEEDWNIEDGHGRVIAIRKQIPVSLAYAFTIHKCQGLTLEYALISFNGMFEFAQAYVALSRVKKLNNLMLTGFNPNCIKADPKVIAYYKELQK